MALPAAAGPTRGPGSLAPDCVFPFSMAVKEQDKTATTKSVVRDVVELVFEQGTPLACRSMIFLGQVAERRWPASRRIHERRAVGEALLCRMKIHDRYRKGCRSL